MSVDANLAYSLSRETGFGAEICKLALERSKNDVKAAQKLLERWGGSKVGRDDSKSFGVVCTYFEQEFKAAVVVKVSCTDELFSKSREFYELVGQIASEIVMWGQAYTAEAAIAEIQDRHNCRIDIESTRFEKTGPFSLLTTYTHRDSIGVILETEVSNKEAFDNKQFRLFSLDCALHIAAFEPLAISKDEIPADIKHDVQSQIEKQLAREGKDMKFWAVATDGKISKWAEQRSLLNQIFIKSDKETVEDIRKKFSEKIGSEITIKRFARFDVGS